MYYLYSTLIIASFLVFLFFPFWVVYGLNKIINENIND